MKCPICDKEMTFDGNPFRPFCSERCKLMDLGNWAGERYRVPVKESLPAEIHRSNGNREE
jgi:endogenous inhibitor of DNA gyrase (YacG/DUF329 family)